jgi:Cys-tRNA synthase (O-phospho-L-seryl-tRNA:Cys-tRNA synthase)|tara:strand:+ start:365 stop:580 length:216 start_codon:yes stop_codon:yes gene_type:complete
MLARSVIRDTLAMSMGMDRVLEEIKFWESKSKKVKSVKNRLERLYTARQQLKDNPKQSNNLVQQLKEINNE